MNLQALARRPWIGVLISAALLAAVLTQLGEASPKALALLKTLPWTAWAAFCLLYLVQPLSDLMIFRRLWRLPVTALPTLLRKMVMNEIVFGYSGEAYFFLWAKRREDLVKAPFAAIKDVNVLSAVIGNAITLLVLLGSAANLRKLDLPPVFTAVLWAGLPVAAISVGVVLFAAKVFSLPRRHLAFVTSVHIVRVLCASGLTLLIWSLAVPHVSAQAWFAVLAIQMLVSRLPLLANKDLVFGNIVLLIMGSDSPVGLLLPALAIATLCVHVAVLSLVGALDLVAAARGSRPARSPPLA